MKLLEKEFKRPQINLAFSNFYKTLRQDLKKVGVPDFFSEI